MDDTTAGSDETDITPATSGADGIGHTIGHTSSASRPSRTAAAWLAVSGSALLLVAAIVVVASRWSLIPPSVRMSGLLVSLIAIAAIAERIKRSAPTTARVTAHLVPAIATTVGIAAGSTLDRSWPTCVVAGGLLGIVVTEVQRRRWRSPRMVLVSSAAALVAAGGMAALSGVPVPLIVAGAAATALVARRQLEATALGLAIAVGPALSVVTTLRIGDGTMTRIGAAGPVVAWSTPIAGAVAAIVLGSLAHRTRSATLMAASVVALVGNGIAGLAVGGNPVADWVTAAVSLLLVIEVVSFAAGDDVWVRIARQVSDEIAGPMHVVGVTVAAPLGLSAMANPASLQGWTVPIGLAALTVSASSLRRIASEPRVADLGMAATTGLAIVTALALPVDTLIAPAIAVAAIACLSSRRLTAVGATARFAVAAFTITVLDHARVDRATIGRWTFDGALTIALVAVGTVVMSAVLARRGRSNVMSGWLIAAAGLLGAAVAPADQQLAALAVIGIVGLIGVWRWHRPASTVVAASIAVVAARIEIGPWASIAIAMASATIAMALSILTGARSERESRWINLTWSPQVVFAGWLALHASHVTLDAITGSMIVAAITLLGLAFVTDRLHPLDAASWAAASLALVTPTFGHVHPALVSLVFLVLGAQGLSYGIARRNREAIAVSSVVASLASFSLWFTSGTNTLVLTVLRRVDITGVDLIVMMLTATLLTIGVAVRSWTPTSTWLAHGPGLVLFSVWTIGTQTGRGADWASIAGIAVGVVSVAVGGWRRLAAPLVIGSISLAVTVVIASGSQLGSLPGWTWLVVGGMVLLGLATAIERRSDSGGDHDDREGLRAMLQRFR